MGAKRLTSEELSKELRYVRCKKLETMANHTYVVIAGHETAVPLNVILEEVQESLGGKPKNTGDPTWNYFSDWKKSIYLEEGLGLLLGKNLI